MFRTLFFISILSSVSVAAEHPGKLSADAWKNVFSKNAAGFSKRPLVSGVSLLSADSKSVKLYYGFFPSLSEVNYLSCATKLDAAFGAQLGEVGPLKDAGVIVLEPTTITDSGRIEEGVLVTWARLLPQSKVQEVHHMTLFARSCKTEDIAKLVTTSGGTKTKGARMRQNATVDLVKYVQELESTERMEARAKKALPEGLEPASPRAPASVKGK